MYVQVVVNTPVDAVFDYHLPPELDGQIEPGHLVQVDFRTAMEPAIVVGVSETTSVARTKPVIARLDPAPVVTPLQIEISRWLASSSLSPLSACLWLWLPPGLTGHSEVVASLEPEYDAAAIKTPEERELVALLQKRGALRARQLNLALSGKNWRAAADSLAKAGVIRKESTLSPPRVRPRVVQTAALAVHPRNIAREVRALERPSLMANLLELVSDVPDIEDRTALRLSGANDAHLQKLLDQNLVKRSRTGKLNTAVEVTAVLAALHQMRKLEKPLRILNILARENQTVEVSWIYAQADAALADLKKLEEAGLIYLGERDSWRDSLAGKTFAAAIPPMLTPEQEDAWRDIRAALSDSAADGKYAGFLLHGVTGSGKTEIYLRAIEAAIAAGRSAILLVPEIALTPQTARRVAARFPGQTAIIHSAISDGERYDTWRRAREGLVRVIVGARSALFAPLIDLGLVILDEEHDSSYKQSPPFTAPHYHARDVAEHLMRARGGVLLLGSATPAVETMFRATRGDFRLLELPRRIMGHRAHIQELSEQAGVLPRYRPEDHTDEGLMIDLPPVETVDMRVELKVGNTGIFSRALQAALKDVLANKEQAILFLNRRGQATYVFCRDCGYVAACPHCETPLTFHRVDEALRCHRCGFTVPQPETCPKCGSSRIRYFGAGTQQVESALVKLFPQARVARWDADTATSHDEHEAIWMRFVQRRVDVMIGTQMIAKGLDLPLVTLVGIVSADIGLALPDFRAGERTFQLLTQVAGRAGRGLLGGRVILQTYQPGHDAIAAAARHDYAAFYAHEIAARRDLGYPPFRRLVRILFRFSSESTARAEAEQAAMRLRIRLAQKDLTGTELIGPAPCFFTRENTLYRWHLLLRGPDPVKALEGIQPRKGWYIDIDPLEVL
ncbi:MAG: primosomal protein N' [Anaerolineae bacterium]|nr:primosomal protein N' [Anaerolineae bacterium]NUQ03002.1 primosomal protein N' [Anaerolineae bacterium]